MGHQPFITSSSFLIIDIREILCRSEMESALISDRISGLHGNEFFFDFETIVSRGFDKPLSTGFSDTAASVYESLLSGKF